MKHLGRIKNVVFAFVLAVAMIMSIFNFRNVTGRNGPKMEGKVLEREED